MNIEELEGKILEKITVEENNEELILHCKEGNYYFTAYGDCCSDSWIEEFESPTKPEKIVKFEETEIDGCDDNQILKTKIRTEDIMDSLELKFYRIITDNGSYLIEMRNNSNGYYGGRLDFNGLKKWQS